MGVLGNTPRRHTVLSLEARKSFAFGLRFLQAADNKVIDLTGTTLRLVIAQPQHLGGAVALTKTATLLDAPLGLAQFELQAAELDLAEGEYPFDVTLLSANGYSTPVMKGVVDVRANTDLEDLNVYAGINPSTNLAVYLEQGGLVEVRVDKVDGLYVVIQAEITAFRNEMNAEVEEAAGHKLLAQNAATNAQVSADAAAASAAQAEAVVSEDLDPKVAALVNNGASVTNDAIETLIGTTAPAAHTHDDRYYTEAEIDQKLQALPVEGHTHDDRYYTEAEVDQKIAAIPAPDLTPYARLDGATFTGPVTLGDADTDVVRRRSLEVETHARSVTNGYTNGKLTSVTEKDGATTVKTTTLAYTGDQLTTVTEVADGLTITTTLTYDGSGTLTGTTRTVA